MHQRTGQRRKAQAHKSPPGYGTQHAAPWGAHLRAPTRYVTSSHLHTPGVPHQAEANKEQPTTAPDPSERTPGKAQRRQTANAMENHHQQPPRPTGIRSNPPPAPGKPPTQGSHLNKGPEDRGTHSKQQDTQTPKAAHQHETTQPPHHMASPPPTPTTPPHNPNTAHQDHPNQPGSTQHTQPTSRLEAAPPPQETTPWPVTPSQPPDTHHNQNPKATTNRPPPPCSPCQRQQPA